MVAVALAGLGEKVVEIGGLGANRDVAVEIRDAAGARRERTRTGADGRVTVRGGEAGAVEVRLG